MFHVGGRPDRQIARPNEANSRFSQLSERAQKLANLM
jgi:hypothetical protein